MKLLKNNVLIDPIDELKEREKLKGIILLEHENVLPWRGRVLEIGKEVKDIKKWDLVIFDRLRVGSSLNNSGHKINMIYDKRKKEEQEFYIIPEDLILALIENE